MRARMLHPEFPKHEGLGSLPRDTRLLFAQLPMLMDRQGRAEDRPRRIQADIFPYDPPEDLDVDEMLNQLVRIKCVVRYEVAGKKYLCIPGFLRWNRPHPREAKSTIPGPPDQGTARPEEGSPRASHEQPRDDQGEPKASQGAPRTVQGSPKANLGVAKDEPRTIQGEPKEDLGSSKDEPRTDLGLSKAVGVGVGVGVGEEQTHVGEAGASPTAGLDPAAPAAVAEQPPLLALSPAPEADPPKAVFAHWVRAMGKRGTVLFDPKRRRKVEQRLAEGYTVEQLCRAVDGCRRSPHHRGETNGTVYDDLELICRDATHVDQFLAIAAGPTQGKPPPAGPSPPALPRVLGREELIKRREAERQATGGG